MGLDRAFLAAAETLRYLNHVADKFDLRRDIQFRSKVAAAHWHEESRNWAVTLEDGSTHTARFLITAIGPLSAFTMPRIEVSTASRGKAATTARWPHEPVSFEGKRVAVIGTGATGVQTIQEVAKTAKSLTVFQRTPNWCAPLHNRKIEPDEMARIRADYPEIFRLCQETFACFLHTADPRGTFDVSPEEREAFFEKLYGEPGFGIWVGNFNDIPDQQGSQCADLGLRRPQDQEPGQGSQGCPRSRSRRTTASAPAACRSRPAITRSTTSPTSELVDLTETPIERITPTGIRTSARNTNST